jgi:membrane protease YdiL (CAAX protease family)
MDTSAPPHPCEFPFWGYSAVVTEFLVGMTSLVVVAIILNVAEPAVYRKLSVVGRRVTSQSLGYALFLAAGSAMFRRRYHQPFLRAVRLSNQPSGLGAALLVGSLLSLAVMLVAAVVGSKAGNIGEVPGGLRASWPAALFGITFGPFTEEAVFRGLLQPVVVRSVGVPLGIGIPALLYGIALMPQYGLTWNCGSVAVASATWGWVRHRTGSTTAAVVAHAAYNGTWVLLMLISHAASG